jgi:hypothetical protein
LKFDYQFYLVYVEQEIQEIQVNFEELILNMTYLFR